MFCKEPGEYIVKEHNICLDIRIDCREIKARAVPSVLYEEVILVYLLNSENFMVMAAGR
jgi:hypothetical protein